MAHLETTEIALYLRGQLTAERSKEVEQHLLNCQPCAELISSESLSLTDVPSMLVGPVAAPAPAPQSPAPRKAPPEPQGSSPSHNPSRSPGSPPSSAGRVPERGEQVGRYLILERVGQGGMGIVYAAWDPDLGRRVAIKLLRTDKVHAEGRTVGQARLLREAQAMARVTHPNVISVYDVSTLGDSSVFVAMEFVDGGTLKQWVKDKPRPWREVLDVFTSAGRGLAGAHKAGLVHRDFKPDNVLIGKDGRIRVTDFGLARLAEEVVEAAARRPTLTAMEAVEESPELAQLTQDGLVVGTLRYMAPEQLSGATPDARSDQFSFCVALYWALYGDWPFDRQRSGKGAYSGQGSSQKGTSRPSQRPGDPRPIDPATGAFEPPRNSKVPGFVRRALMRGLSPAPADRFESMEALLTKLEYRPRQVRMAAAAATLALVVGVGGYGWYAQAASQQQALVCTGADQKLAGVWDDAARRQVTEALVATKRPGAAEVASRVTGLLDGYARGWVETSTEACRATRVRGAQTEELLSLQVLCLERRLKDVKAVTGVLAAADPELVEKAVDTVSLLPSLKSCSDVASLSQVEPPPDSAQARAEIERISGMVAEVKALTDAGRYAKGLEVAEPAVKAASALGYRPLEAEALLWRGWLEARRDEPLAAEKYLTQALWAALASRSDEVLARAATLLVYTVGNDSKRSEAALQWSELAKAALARMGGNEDIESDLFKNVGVTYTVQRKHAEALAAYERALQLSDRALGPEHVRRSAILGNIGSIYKRENRLEDASRVLTEALELRERLSGPTHPLAGLLHYSLSQTYLRLEDLEKARVHVLRALEIDVATFGPEHPTVGGTYDVVGTVYLQEKKFREALEAYEKALAIKEKALGKNHEDVSYSACGVARSLAGLGQNTRALPFYARVLEINPPDPVLKGDTYLGMAQALDAQGKKSPQILALARKARAEFDSAKVPEAVAEVDAWIAKRSGSKAGSRLAGGR
ncbi:MAG TPA: tetratricopeptide repeat protein [Myxococcaceae bacterium]|jgi:serine/threonine protein kinase/tetratricopeptide (TPR) repeat protein